MILSNLSFTGYKVMFFSPHNLFDTQHTVLKKKKSMNNNKVSSCRPADPDRAEKTDGEGKEEEDPKWPTQRVKCRAHERGQTQVRCKHTQQPASVMKWLRFQRQTTTNVFSLTSCSVILRSMAVDVLHFGRFIFACALLELCPKGQPPIRRNGNIGEISGNSGSKTSEGSHLQKPITWPDFCKIHDVQITRNATSKNSAQKIGVFQFDACHFNQCGFKVNLNAPRELIKMIPKLERHNQCKYEDVYFENCVACQQKILLILSTLASGEWRHFVKV